MNEPTPGKNYAATTAGAVTLALALVFTGLFVVIPGIYNLVLSFKDFNVMHGLFGSPWAGLKNYAEMIQSNQFRSSALWTLRYSAINAAVLFVLSLGFGSLINAIRIKWVRHALCTLLLLPLVVPGELWAAGFLGIFTVKGTDGNWLLPFWNALKYMGLPALLVTASLSNGKRSPAVPLLSAGAAALALFALLGRADFTMLRALYNPLNGIQPLDDFVYRTGLMQMKYGASVIAHLSISVMRCLLLAAVAWPVAAMLRRLFPATDSPAPALTHPRDRLASLAAAGAVALAALAALGALTLTLGSGKGVSAMELRLLPGIPLYTALAFITALINTVLCFLLARPAACGGKSGRKAMLAVLIVLTAMSMTAYSIGEYMIFRSLGLFNTMFAVVLSGIGAVWGVWPLLFAAKGLGVQNDVDWFRRMWKPAIGLFAIQWIIKANDTLPVTLYTHGQKHPLELLMTQIVQTGNANDFALISLITLALPVALLLIVRTVFNEKDNLALFLPGK